MKLASAENIRELDKCAIEEGTSLRKLMNNAGKAVCNAIKNQFGSVAGKNCVVLCGNGNNGGDGFVCAKYLAYSGANVTIAHIGNEKNIRFETLTAYQSIDFIKKISIKDENLIETIKLAEIIVDGVYGTGFRGVIKEEVQKLFIFCNELSAFKVSIDLPSGVLCDTGKIGGVPFKADLTVALCLPKLCHFIYPASKYCGQLKIFDIGVPNICLSKLHITSNLIDSTLIKEIFPNRKRNSHKGTYGKALLLCGSKNMTGAAYFAAAAAGKSGAGLV